MRDVTIQNLVNIPGMSVHKSSVNWIRVEAGGEFPQIKRVSLHKIVLASSAGTGQRCSTI